MSKKPLDRVLQDFLELWPVEILVDLLEDLFPLFDLYEPDGEGNWCLTQLEESDKKDVRMVRTIYLISKLCDRHSGRIAKTKVDFKDLWLRLEKIASDYKKHQENQNEI